MPIPDLFRTHSLDKHPKGDAIRQILSSSIQAVDPNTLVQQFIQRDRNTLWINGNMYPVEQGRIVLLGLGKAANAMVSPIADLLADLNPRGLVIPKSNTGDSWESIEIQPSGHPIPNENSLLAGAKAIKLLEDLSEKDLLICLISGGGSSLMMTPLPGIHLSEIRQLNSTLLSCGAAIDEINIIRRHIDQLKGGGLAKLTTHARVVSLILSDVIGNSLEAIASGPTAPDPTTKEDALGILDKYRLGEKIPSAILTTLQNASETVKPGNKIFENVSNIIIASNETATKAAVEQARKEGFQSRSIGSSWQGEARLIGSDLCAYFSNPGLEIPFCLVGGGETSVTIQGEGHGGRNQEMALAAVEKLTHKKNSMLITLATDGEDGITDAAGAVVTNDTLQRGKDLGMEPGQFLERNDSYTYFDSLGDLFKPGASGTNVNDLYFLIVQ